MRKKHFDYCFLALGLLIQIVTFFLMPHESWLSLLSGMLGVCSVCMASQGNILTFAFGFGQVLTYTWLCVTQRFYGEIAINAYYFITMIYGVFVWRKRVGGTKDSEMTVHTRQMKVQWMAVIVVLTAFVSWLTGWGLSAWTDDTQPYLDAFTTIPALVAQVLLILVYREHWFIWLAVDVVSVVLWLRAGDYCMTAQYAFWCANCIYGLKRWKSLQTD